MNHIYSNDINFDPDVAPFGGASCEQLQPMERTCSITADFATFFSGQMITFQRSGARCLTAIFESRLVKISLQSGPDSDRLLIDFQNSRVILDSEFNFWKNEEPVLVDKLAFQFESKSKSNALLVFDDVDIYVTSANRRISLYVKFEGDYPVSGLCAKNVDSNDFEVLESVSQSDKVDQVCFLPSGDVSRKSCNLDEAEAVCSSFLNKANFDQCFEVNWILFYPIIKLINLFFIIILIFNILISGGAKCEEIQELLCSNDLRV